MESIGVLGDELGEARLVEADLAGGELGDLRLVDVHRPDLVALGGEACCCHEADPSDPDDPDGFAHLISFVVVAIASICDSSSVCSSVLLTQ